MSDWWYYPEDDRLVYFTYLPANVYPQVAVGLYAAAALILVWQIERSHAQRWLYILPGTALAEALGYVFRTICVTNTTFTMYVLMTLFLLVPVNALALANYRAVGKVIRDSGAPSRKFWLRPAFVSWFYFSSDVFSIAMQGAGGGMMTSMKTRDTGKYIVMVGLSVQLLFFACYLVTAIHIWRSPKYTVYVSASDRSVKVAKCKVFGVLTATTILLYLRSIYRIVEFADGYGGKIYSSEWAFYAFDTIIIFLAFLVYIAVFIGRNFPRSAYVDVEKAATAAYLSSTDAILPPPASRQA
ncbi:hypothetical protein LPJ61_005081 [Coemansia biformis]|uniref:RTA1-domain-containing protein n=1 Tax=Coemansia biformis TaxID=1286918 RepID=A0A9W7Y8Z6_9FUNG|nr:hypothetical protein LPJ61_005081 [Coemansia biformis]